MTHSSTAAIVQSILELQKLETNAMVLNAVQTDPREVILDAVEARPGRPCRDASHLTTFVNALAVFVGWPAVGVLPF